MREQVVAVALEAVVGRDPQVDVEVAGRATPRADGPAAGQPQGRPGVDARGDVDGVGALLDRAGPRPGTRRTGWR